MAYGILDIDLVRLDADGSTPFSRLPHSEHAHLSRQPGRPLHLRCRLYACLAARLASRSLPSASRGAKSASTAVVRSESRRAGSKPVANRPRAVAIAIAGAWDVAIRLLRTRYNMGEFSGPGTYEVLATCMQRDRLFDVDLDSGLGRKPTPVPAHLSRVLYVPRHSMLNLSLYEAGLQYRQAVDHSPVGGEQLTGRASMGSRLFKTRINTMTCPAGDAQAEYVIGLDVEKIRDGGDISATVHRADQAGAMPHINIILPMLTDIFSLLSVTSDQHSDTIDVSTTYPLPRLRSIIGALHFPYSRFSIPNAASVYEWQIHPLDHGTLRYTLVELDDETRAMHPASGPQESNIKAIYHHIGYHASLFLPHSKGILLVPEVVNDKDRWLESVIVSSLIGLLWRIRGLEIKEHEPQAAGEKKRPSLIKRVFGKK